jgi:hypothetical protein
MLKIIGKENYYLNGFIPELKFILIQGIKNFQGMAL